MDHTRPSRKKRMLSYKQKAIENDTHWTNNFISTKQLYIVWILKTFSFHSVIFSYQFIFVLPISTGVEFSLAAYLQILCVQFKNVCQRIFYMQWTLAKFINLFSILFQLVVCWFFFCFTVQLSNTWNCEFNTISCGIYDRLFMLFWKNNFFTFCYVFIYKHSFMLRFLMFFFLFRTISPDFSSYCYSSLENFSVTRLMMNNVWVLVVFFRKWI